MPTTGPSSESRLGVSRIGMACHIYAAADGPAARRVDQTRSMAELKAIENGVWMCYTHGKLIDTDECTYSPELLKDWRDLAERRAHLRLEFSGAVDLSRVASLPLARAKMDLLEPDTGHRIEGFLRASAMAQSWGNDEALGTRDLLIELARNALTHGRATGIRLEATVDSIHLSDDGQVFPLKELLRSAGKRGGAAALEAISTMHDQLVVFHRATENGNLVTITRIEMSPESPALSPCSFTLTGGWPNATSAIEFVESHGECETVFLFPTLGILSYSDLFKLSDEIKQRGMSGRDIVLAMQAHSVGILNFVEREMPNVRLIELKRRPPA